MEVINSSLLLSRIRELNIKGDMIEARYYLDRKRLTHRIVHIEPEREYCYEVENPGLGPNEVSRLIYNDIDLKTGDRTGRYYRASDLFKTEKECNVALRKQIKENIRAYHKEICRLEKQCKKLELLIKRY